MSESEQPQPPTLRIVHGDPTPEEIAAVVTVLAAASGGSDSPTPSRSTWGGRKRPSWRSSALPR